jgi:UDP-N-acetylmuramoyl-tripeptide--D-alanyl-D-alanine ligase
MTIENLYEIYKANPSIQTDTRKLKQGDIYFALKGEHFNGNVFALNALEQGASYAVVDEEVGSDDPRIIQVDDVLKTLQELAGHHRNQFQIPFIAITGSNGKTTTKELVHAVLSKKFITYTTEGNLNNHIGIPLTILKIGMNAEMAIVEMGANHQKEIEGYCSYTRPTHGLITNCGKAHLEGFGGVEGVRKGKGELFDALRVFGGTVFVYKDYDYLSKMSTGIANCIEYSSALASPCRGIAMDSGPFLTVKMDHDQSLIETNLVGAYNLPNVLAAVCIGKNFGVDDHLIHEALSEYQPSNSRSQWLKVKENEVILDAYNANPSSMKLAIENFANLSGTRKWLALGAMMEMGADAEKEHEILVDLIRKHTWEQVILVGMEFQPFAKEFQWFQHSAEAAVWFKDTNPTGIQLLLKGSRSMKMEKLLD